MTVEDYRKVLGEAAMRLAAINHQREEIEIESAKLLQFISATINMLPDAESSEFKKLITEVTAQHEARAASLTETIRRILQDEPNDWLTAVQVRDRLVGRGFDFSGYTSNPLASVSTTLKRLKSDEVESCVIEGVAAYRWRHGQAVRPFGRRMGLMNSLGGTLPAPPAPGPAPVRPPGGKSLFERIREVEAEKENK